MLYKYTLFLSVVFLFLLPGILIRSFVKKDSNWSFLDGAILGFALAVYCSYAISYLSLDLLSLAYLLFFLVVIYKICRKGFSFTRRDLLGSFDAPIIIVALIVFISRTLVAYFHEIPLGWDPTFHLILIRKIALTDGIISDWEPFEQVQLNYPLGAHFLVAMISRFTKLEFHSTFMFLFPLVATINTLQIYAFGKRITDVKSIPIYAAISYGLWAIYGSLDYVRWGGLPNLLAMTFFLQCLIICSYRKYDFKNTIFFSICFIAIIMTHHHVAITASFLFLILFFYFYVQKDYLVLRFLLLSGALGGIAGSFYVVPYFLKIFTLGSTSVFKYQEKFFDIQLIVNSFGGLFLFTSLLGLLLIILLPKFRKISPLLFCPIFGLIFLFVSFEYVYRFYSIKYLGEDVVAFTPSRFLSNLSYFICFFFGSSFRLSARGCSRNRFS